MTNSLEVVKPMLYVDVIRIYSDESIYRGDEPYLFKQESELRKAYPDAHMPMNGYGLIFKGTDLKPVSAPDFYIIQSEALKDAEVLNRHMENMELEPGIVTTMEQAKALDKMFNNTLLSMGQLRKFLNHLYEENPLNDRMGVSFRTDDASGEPMLGSFRCVWVGEDDARTGKSVILLPFDEVIEKEDKRGFY